MTRLAIINNSELRSLQNPSQYLGGERGSIDKSNHPIDLHVCLAFPDTYEVGMSHIGIQILYDLINQNENYWAERVYVPLSDMEELLRSKDQALGSLESKRPLHTFDVVGFSLQYELCMNGILNILDLGQIPLLAKDRDETMPLIIGGGPVTYHPEPFADIFDAFLVGDGEELVPEFLDAVCNLPADELSRTERLSKLAEIPGVYVPQLFEPHYDARGVYLGIKPLKDGYTKIDRRIISSLEGAPFPESPIVPNSKAVHNRLAVEVMRGCVRGCRFCQAGYLYRPQRERSPEDIIRIVKNSISNTGHEELSLLSLSTADYCSILPLLSSIKERFAENNQLAISFPSTRVDALKPELLQEVQPVRRSGFTIAPEAGTQRLRDVINKGVSEEELMDTCKNVFKLGWSSIKMYFMIGLPTETQEDIDGIIDLAKKVKSIAGNKKTVTVSVSTHVPKPHTPFQWAAQITQGETIKIQNYLFQELKKIGVVFRYHKAFATFLEGVFARGGRELLPVILSAYKRGARLDAWVEELDEELWLKAFEECSIDPHHYLHERDVDQPLPWDHISCDIPKRYFAKEWERASAARTTPDCLTKSCSVCGACDYDATRNVLFDRARTESRLGIIEPAWQKIIDKRESGQRYELLDSEVEESDSDVKVEETGSYDLTEYLQTETDDRRRVFAKESAPPEQRIRIRYSKTGNAVYFSHLELATMFFRAGRRADIPMCFTQGFHPKPKLSFGPPLQLGLASSWEYVDLFLERRMDLDDLLNRFNQQLPQGLALLEAEETPVRTRAIQDAIVAQQFEVQSDIFSAGSWTLAKDWGDQSVTRTRKKKTKTVRLGDCVGNLELIDQKLRFSLRYDTVRTLKPFEVLHAVTNQDAAMFEIVKSGVTFDS